MLEVKNWQVYGLEKSIIASGNPTRRGEIENRTLDDNDWYRAQKLGSMPTGLGHDHYLIGIRVIFDIKYPQYWSMEAQRYHWFDIISSQSKMHTLCISPAKISDFNKYVDPDIVERINVYIKNYQEAQTKSDKYFYFMKALSNLPMGFELWMTCTLSYLQLKTIVKQRKNHYLQEDWGVFCNWALSLPHFSELTGIQGE